VPFFSDKRTLFLLAIIGAVLVWNHYREPDHMSAPESQRPLPQVVVSPQPSPAGMPPPTITETPVPPSPPATIPPAADSPVAATSAPANPAAPATRILPGSVDEIPAAAEDITEDLDAVDATIRDFRAVLGENPIGSNAEITGALLGNNLKQIKLKLPEGSQLNGEGEMCDRWGTPYFFHQLSATEMEIRSAGPDREMWTGDDSQM
jgi:hypothetical protein